MIHQGGQNRPLFTPATWEPESSEEDEPDRAEYTQDPLTHPPRLLSQATSKVARLVPRPKTPPKSSPVPKTPPKHLPLTARAISSSAASSSKGAAKPKFSGEGLSSKGSVPTSSSEGARPKFSGEGSLSKGSVAASSSSKDF